MSDVNMSAATLEQLLELNPTLARCSIRIDKQTQKGSAIDVIRMITSKNSRHAGEALNRLDQDLVARCDHPHLF
jgi:hypothetical protein